MAEEKIVSFELICRFLILYFEFVSDFDIFGFRIYCGIYLM